MALSWCWQDDHALIGSKITVVGYRVFTDPDICSDGVQQHKGFLSDF
ncbi:Unknown protein sequence [Pseudomonas syringae pv. aceris]|nr:Unknown protein sequence [Pseudomonas syringae pv. aceris]